jgi:hypothetical protein
MVVRNKIWEELKQAHVNVLCLRSYTDRQRKYERYYQCFIALTASVGTFGYIFKEWIPFVSSLIIAFVSIAKSLFPQFIQPEKELCILDEIMDFYNEYMNDLELLMYNLDKETINEGETMNKLHSLKAIECKKQSIMNRFVWSITERQMKQLEKESTEYINKVYYDKYESEVK